MPSGEPLDRLGIHPDRLGGFGFGRQGKPERADFRLEHPGVEHLAPPTT
jgi:hypothetical protein